MDVRRITEADIEDVVELAREMHAAGSFSRFDFDPSTIRGVVRMALGDPKLVFCAIARRHGAPVGAFLGHKTRFFFGSTPLAQELGNYVTPSARGTSAAVRMCRMFEAWAKEMGVGVVQVGVTVGINDEQATRFYEKLGYDHIGVALRKELA